MSLTRQARVLGGEESETDDTNSKIFRNNPNMRDKTCMPHRNGHLPKTEGGPRQRCVFAFAMRSRQDARLSDDAASPLRPTMRFSASVPTSPAISFQQLDSQIDVFQNRSRAVPLADRLK